MPREADQADMFTPKNSHMCCLLFLRFLVWSLSNNDLGGHQVSEESEPGIWMYGKHGQRRDAKSDILRLCGAVEDIIEGNSWVIRAEEPESL